MTQHLYNVNFIYFSHFIYSIQICFIYLICFRVVSECFPVSALATPQVVALISFLQNMNINDLLNPSVSNNLSSNKEAYPIKDVDAACLSPVYQSQPLQSSLPASYNYKQHSQTTRIGYNSTIPIHSQYPVPTGQSPILEYPSLRQTTDNHSFPPYSNYSRTLNSQNFSTTT